MSSKVSPHSSAIGNSSGSGPNSAGATGTAPRRHPPNRSTAVTTGGTASSSSTTNPHNSSHPHPHYNKLGGKKRKTIMGGSAKFRMGSSGIPSAAAAELAGRLAAETSATTLPAPPSSPVPPDEDDLDGDLDMEEIDVELDEDGLEEEEEEDSEDLDDEEVEEEEDELAAAPPATVRLRRPHHLHHPPRGGLAGDLEQTAFDSPIFLGSTTDEDDDEEEVDDEDDDGAEVDESLERDESDDEDDDDELEPQEFLLPPDGDSSIQGIPPDAQARLEAFFEAAGFTDGKAMSDPESLRKLTLTVSSALGEASAAINRMRDSQRKSVEEGRNDSGEEGDSLLALACSSGYFELARVLLAMGANVDDRGSKGDLTPLMDAASQGHLEIVRLLLSHGAEVNAQSACGNSPLMYACAAGHEDVVHELLKTGANVEDNNENGHTPLMEAASAGHVGVAKILLDHGAGINTHSNEFKESALTVACYKGHLNMVRFLLDAGADQQHKTDEMHTALMEASMDGHVEVARLLLDSGAQVNMPADSFESPLTLAACGGHVDLAELLVERGANIEEVNDEGYTPLMEASREGHLAVVQSLLRNGALINAQTEETHETALTLGACGGFLDVVDILCKSGADIELGASTPLMEASQEGHLQVVKYLLDRGIDIHRQTQSNDTALSYACENGHLEVAELLVEMGANPEHLSEGGRTPIMKACRGGHVEVIKFLLQKGADVNRQTTSNDHTSLSLASAGGHLTSVQLLLAAGANPFHKLKDNSAMIIEAARGGHTLVIRALLDYAPHKSQAGAAINEKATQQGGKPGMVGKVANTAGKNQKVVPVDSTKTGPLQGAPVKNIMSVLRKSRSTSTLESTAPPQTKESFAEGKTKTVIQQQPLAEQLPTLARETSGKNLDAGDAGLEKSLHNQNIPKPMEKKAGLTVTDGAVQGQSIAKSSPSALGAPTSGSSKSSNDGPGGNEASQPGVCTECSKGKESQVQVITQVMAGQVNVKRPAGTDPLLSSGSAAAIGIPVGTTTTTPGVIIPVPMSTAAVPVGPPLVPSQVTAATAISERPKAKANKPSARKQIQLQQQGQAGSSTVTSPGGASDKSETSPMGSPNSASSGLSPGAVVISTSAAPTSPGNIKVPSNSGSCNSVPSAVSGPSGFLQMQVQQVRGHPVTKTHLKLDPKQLTQILAQHQQQFINYKGDKSKPGTGTLPIAGNEQSVSSPTGPGGLPTTNGTTTTTVVVTHGNGEMETIIEGDNLLPGTNEMIMSAAAAAFPLECFPMPSSIQMNPASGVHVQSYQMSSPSSELIPGPLTTTTMQTTTIINSAAGNFPPQMILSHPPPLPAAIAAAAAAAGVLPPSGAPPPGALKGITPTPVSQIKGKDPQVTTTQKPCGTGTGKTPTPAAGPTPQPAPVPVPSVSSVAGLQPVKKQLAKRSRPFGQPSQGAPQPRQSNQQTQTHTHTHGHALQVKQNQSVASTQTTLTGQHGEKAAEKSSGALTKHFDVDCSTESGGETSLSVAAAAGHLETVEFLLIRKAYIEHRDKKGCTPVILAADAGYDKVVDLLLSNGSDMEAQSERTKDTALSLACTKGRFEVVELLLKKGANKEHRNVSDYTPLSLAASGGYVNVIKLLLQHGAEINSRTGSKLGISPLMLAAMNGNTPAVKLLLDMGSDINAQIETNKNTALTLACFQGRHEVVSLLLDRKANLEHRAKTGLTPLMEAANGGYTEVGKTLLDRGADVNAAPVPATKDTALTIAADKGHYRFVELLLQRGGMVEVRNKKGCTPIWLACHGGHADVVQILFRHGADLDVQDNRKVSCLMAGFRKGHVKVIRWVVKNVQQFPSDVEMIRYYASIQSEADLLKRCQQCAEFVKQAKDKQALEANKNASILLEELDMEKSREELKKQAAARRREKKKKKKQEKKRGTGSKDDDDDDDNDEDDQEALQEEDEDDCTNVIDSGIDANSLGSNSSAGERNAASRNKNNKENLNNEAAEEPVVRPEPPVTLSSSRHRKKKNKKKDKLASVNQIPEESQLDIQKRKDILREKDIKIATILEEAKSQGKVRDKRIKKETEEFLTSYVGGLKGVQSTTGVPTATPTFSSKKVTKGNSGNSDMPQSTSSVTNTYHHPEPLMGISLNPTHLRKSGASNFDSHGHDMSHSQHHNYQNSYATSTKSGAGNSGATAGNQSGSGKGGRKDDGWKEVTRNCPSSRSKKVIVPSSVISRVIGRGGCNINAIREATGAHIEVEKQQKGQVQPERTIQIKGSADSTKQAHILITNLMNEPDLDIKKLLAQCVITSAWTGTTAVAVTSAITIPAATRAQNVITNQAPSSQESNQSVSLMQIAGVVAATGGKTKNSNKIPSSPPNLSSVSPPIKKTATSIQGIGGNVFKGTNNCGVVKKSLVFTPSSNSAASATVAFKNSQTSFASKLAQPQIACQSSGINGVGSSAYQQPQQGNTTPTPTKPASPPFNITSRSTPTSTPPPMSSSPGLSSGSMSMNANMTANPKPIAPPAQQIGKERISNPMIGNGKGFVGQMSQSLQQSGMIGNTSLTPPAPGNPSNSGFQTRTALESRTDTESPQMSNQPAPPLEYSPFSYQFSNNKTSWFPTDLGHNPNAMLTTDASGSSGMHSGPGSTLGQLGSASNPNLLAGISSASRAMNFASVAASGISTTTAAQMTQAGIHNGMMSAGVVPNLGLAPIGTTSLKNVDGLIDSDMPKVQADASKAPGYRGSNMGSPVLRLQQQPQIQTGPPIGNFGMENAISSHYSAPPGGMTSLSQGAAPTLLNFNPTSSPRHMNMNSQSGGMAIGGPGFGLSMGQHGQQEMQNQGLGLSHQQQQHFANNSGGLPGAPPPTTIASSGVPTNVVVSRLNPRAPSFKLPQQPQMNPGGGQSQPNVSNYQQPGQQQYNSIHQPQQHPAFKMGQMNQYGGRSNNNMAVGRPPGSGGMNAVGTGWNSYSQEGPMFDLQGLAALAGTSGAIDPQALLSGMENPLHDNQNSMKLGGDRRVPRAIGEERSWKNTGTSNLGNLGPFGSLEGLDQSQMSQGVFQQPQQVQGVPQHQQASNWMGIYGGSNPQFPGSNMQQPPPHANVNVPIPQRGNDTRGFLGRRFMEEMDQNRMLELQQMYDGRLVNGGGVPPTMMHMPPVGGQIYPFGVEVDHLNQHMPKVDQHNNSWGDNSHLLMDDKHNMGWGAKWGN